MRKPPSRRMPRGLVAVVLLVVGLAGCTANEPAGGPTPSVTVDPNRPDTSFGDVATGPAVGPDLNATTAAAPRLVEGEWWRIEFSSDFYAATEEVVRVVANATEAGYIIGMPHEGWFKEAIAYHAPAFGDVALDLSYNTHNVRFEPVRFPLTAGATWETEFATQPLVATVESADQYTATIRFHVPAGSAQPTDPLTGALGLTPSGAAMVLTYDARQHEIVEMQSFIGSWKVVEHGYGYEGWVTVPRGEHTAIDYGTFWPTSQQPPATTRTADVSGGYNRLTMMHLIAPVGPGSYRITSTAPNGTAFTTETVGGDYVVKFYEATDPDGTWTLEDFAAGPGATYSMGIAYHQYDIHLPDGLRRTDHSHPVVR
jgi:hypothetical protein